jgi:hypothetical protein
MVKVPTVSRWTAGPAPVACSPAPANSHLGGAAQPPPLAFPLPLDPELPPPLRSPPLALPLPLPLEEEPLLPEPELAGVWAAPPPDDGAGVAGGGDRTGVVGTTRIGLAGRVVTTGVTVGAGEGDDRCGVTACETWTLCFGF